MRMFSQEDVLNQDFRAGVIKEIQSGSNQARKREALKRQDCYRDNTIKWVLKSLKELGLKDATLDIMQNHAANISIVKKVVNKKARAYRGQVQRDAKEETSTAKVMSYAAAMGINEQMKKADAMTVLQHNSLLMVLPEPTPEKKVRLRPTVLGPWQFDVIEDGRNPEKPGAIILSEWVDDLGTISFNSDQIQAIDSSAVEIGNHTIATGPHVTNAQQKKSFIWWTDSYHFTTDDKGQIIQALSPEGLLNPIGMISGVTINQDQDGSFWSRGGEDLVDGAVLVNLMCTDMNAIMYMQGWGQLVISGPNIPTSYQIGPHVALTLETREGQEAPKVELLANNPPIDSWLRVIEQYVALLLSTNDLSSASVSMKLDAANFPSGVAMLIDKAEATGSIEDRRQSFAQAERRMWKIIAAWLNVYSQSLSLDEEFAEIGTLDQDIEVSMRFSGEEQITTEKEKLEILKMRKELGLASQLDLIKADNPNMTDDEARRKLQEVKQEMQLVAEQMAKVVDQNVADKSSNGQSDSNKVGKKAVVDSSAE